MGDCWLSVHDELGLCVKHYGAMQSGNHAQIHLARYTPVAKDI